MATQHQIEKILEQARQEFVFSAYQCIAESPTSTLSLARGVYSYWGIAQNITEASWFDLASLTKALCTTSILARWAERGVLDIEAPLETVAAEWRGSGYGKLPLCDLLAHAGGLLDWYPLYQETDWKTCLRENESTFILCKPRQKVCYSDIGFLLLGTAIESVSGQALNQVFESEVCAPLQISGLAFNPPNPMNCVATEWRAAIGTPLRGKSFDENSEAMLGVAPHAGLFGSAKSVLPIVKEWLLAIQGRSSWLQQKTAQRFTQRSELVSGSSWALGWDTRSFQGSSAGSVFSQKSFGHLGFTGTSIWVDPEVQGICIFLTNRVHPSRVDDRIRRVRPILHDEVAHFWRSHS